MTRMLLRRGRSETKTRIAHALAGFNICVEGWERVEEGARVGGGLLILLGVLLLLLARFHTKLHSSTFAAHLDFAAFLLEASVMAIVAALYYERGKHLLPWCYGAVAVAYISLAIWRRARGSGVHGPLHGST